MILEKAQDWSCLLVEECNVIKREEDETRESSNARVAEDVIGESRIEEGHDQLRNPEFNGYWTVQFVVFGGFKMKQRRNMMMLLIHGRTPSGLIVKFMCK